MKRPCMFPDCGQRRLHSDGPYEPRGTQMVEAADDCPPIAPVFCSFTCAISDGWMSVRYESPDQEKARQDTWYRRHEVKDG